jgi:pyruvate dehydrogenase E1 component beta subunit
VIVHEAPVTGGYGAEVSAVIAEGAIEYLDGPILRVGAPWCSVPANRNLEQVHYLPTAEKVADAVLKVVEFGGTQ